MAHPALSTFSKDSSQAIYVYTTPLRNDYVNGNLKKPINMVSHWAVCIQHICDEVRVGDKKKGEPDFLYGPIPEQEWKAKRQFKAEPKLVGYMIKPFTPADIDEVASKVWNKTMKGKYIFDEKNCQTFARYLIELIGDPNTKANLPHIFDELVKAAGITRDVSILGLATGMVLMGVSVVTLGADGGTAAAAGFSVAGTRGDKEGNKIETWNITCMSKEPQGNEQRADEVEARVLEEIKDCTCRDVDGFFTKYLEGKDWTERTEKVYDAVKS